MKLDVTQKFKNVKDFQELMIAFARNHGLKLPTFKFNYAKDNRRNITHVVATITSGQDKNYVGKGIVSLKADNGAVLYNYRKIPILPELM